MEAQAVALDGRFIRLEPLEPGHVAGLVAAAAADPTLYQWSPVPQGAAEATAYVATALAWWRAGTALPFALVRANTRQVLGSTRFWNLEYWSWPATHPRRGRDAPDTGEIGYTWLTSSAIRTAANTEAKLLMLAHAFEVWSVLRVCFHTDERNARSRAALERLGAQFEGILRAHRLAADSAPRNSVRFSILASEWPAVKEHLQQRLGRGRTGNGCRS